MKRLDQFQIENLFSKNSQVALVASDAGGGNILNSLSQLGQTNWIYFFEGFSKKLVPPKKNYPLKDLDSVLHQGTTAVITATSVDSSRWELLALRKSKDAGVVTFTFLDHWLDFRERFRIRKTFEFPDIILGWRSTGIYQCFK